jgi:hypothetical protein
MVGGEPAHPRVLPAHPGAVKPRRPEELQQRTRQDLVSIGVAGDGLVGQRHVDPGEIDTIAPGSAAPSSRSPSALGGKMG